MGSISAEQHNMTRRATKAKRKASAKRGGNNPQVETESVLAAAIKDRRRAEWVAKKKEENKARLLATLNEKKILVLTLCYDSDAYEDYSAFLERAKTHEHNVRDIKAAIKELPAADRKRYRWEETQDASGDTQTFRVAVIRAAH